MFGRLVVASLLIVAPGVAAAGATQHAADSHPAGHRPLAMHTAHVQLADDSPYLGPEPCSRYFAQKKAFDVPDAYGGRNPLAVCGYTPEQLRGAYGVADSGLTGKGVTVAIVDAYASPTGLADANRYARRRGDRAFRPGQFREVVPPAYHHLGDDVCEAPESWGVEEALDVEAVHAMAPDADIVYVAAASCDDTDLMAALQTVVDGRLASIVSGSWGGVPHGTLGDEDPATMAAYSALFQHGGQQGISFLFASGDCADQDPATGCGAGAARRQTTYPAQDPWVTAVGGTSLAVGPFDDRTGETGWGDWRSLLAPGGASWSPLPGRFRFGSGGGTSEDVAQPDYQRGVVPAALSGTLLTGAKAARPMRVVPDVAMAADPMTGFLVGVSEHHPDGSFGYGESAIGGTSLATPLFAGMQALAQQAAGHPFGFLNPGLYAKAGSAALADVTATSMDAPSSMDGPTHRPGEPLLSVVDLGVDSKGVHQARLYRLGDDGLLATAPGYDAVTGLGSLTGAYVRSGG
jgi:subtilase family serine protease